MKGNWYPSWRYHRTLDPRLVFSAEEDKAIGDEWSDTPATFESVAEAADPTPPVALEAAQIDTPKKKSGRGKA